MTTITQDVTTIAGVDDNTSWTFYTKEIRESDAGDAIITTKKARKYPVAGVLTVELDPGPAVVMAADGKHYAFTVPDIDSQLWPLIQAAVTIPPGTRHQEILDAVDAWLEVNTDVWASIPDKPAVIAAGATQSEARSAIGVDLIDLDEWAWYANFAAFPSSGQTTDKVYGARDTGGQYRWDGAAYVLITRTPLTPTAVKTSGYTAIPGDLIPADATAGGFTVTLPSAPVDKTTIFVKKLDSSANVVTVARGGSDVFNIASGATSLQLTMPDQTVALQYKASGGIWYVTGHGAPVAGFDARYDARYYSATSVHAASSKTTPVDADEVAIVDSEAANGLKKLTWANLKATLKTYFDSVTTTLTNKAITPRVLALVDSHSVDVNCDNYDVVVNTGIASGTVTINAPTGTPVPGQKLRYAFTGTNSRTLSWNAAFEASTYQAIPTTTSGTLRIDVPFIWNAANSKWHFDDAVNIPGERAAVRTLTNARITPRIGTTASSATPTVDADAHDQYNVTALAVGATFGAPTGTPTDGQKVLRRIKDNGTARTLAHNAIYRAIGVTLPTTTVINKTLYMLDVYNAADTKWDVIDVKQEA